MGTSSVLREKVATDTLFLMGRSIVVRIIAFPVSLVTARVLGPEIFGLLGIINQVPSLAKFGSLSYSAVAVRELLHLREGGQTDSVVDIKSVSFTADLLVSFLVALGLMSVSFFFDRLEVRWGLRIATLSLLLSQLARLYVANVRLDKNFKLLAKVQTVGQFINAAVVLSTIYFLGIYSVLGAAVLAGLGVCILYQRSVGLNFRVSLNRAEFGRQTRVAIPFALGTISLGAFGWTERALVGGLYGLENLGIYILTVTAVDAGLMVAISLMEAANVHLYERLGRRGGAEALGNAVFLPTIMLTYSFPVIGATVIFVGPPLIQTILPAFTGVITLIPWVAAILWVRAAPFVYLTSMNSARLNQQRRVVIFWIISIGIFAGTTALLSYFGFGLVAPMAGKLLGFSALGIFGIYSTRSFLFESRSQLRSHLISYLVPLVWGGLAALVAWQIGRETWLTSILSLAVFAILYAPLLIWRAKAMGLIVMTSGLHFSFGSQEGGKLR